MKSQKVTVAICTWNRAAALDRTLAEMRNLRIPEGVDWELLVVNNNCTDNTDAILAKHARHLPLRRLFEPTLGLSNARNCAVAAATGALVLWTDDDVTVDPSWLENYVAAARDFPEAGYFGGAIEPGFEVTPPRWLRQNLNVFHVYALIDLGRQTRPLKAGESVFGANMAFRTEILRRFPFNPRLGVCGKGRVAGEEEDVIERAQQAGACGVWVGTSRVRHVIPPDRTTIGYLWKHFYGLGQTEARMGGWERFPRLFGVPRFAVRAYYTGRLKKWMYAPFRNLYWATGFRADAKMKGYIDEIRRLKRGPLAGIPD